LIGHKMRLVILVIILSITVVDRVKDHSSRNKKQWF